VARIAGQVRATRRETKLTETRKGKRTIRDLRIKLAEYLIQFEEGQRLPSIRDLAKVTHMSVGSVSTALNDLQTMGAVKLQNRGHLGSTVTELAWGALWNVVEQGPLVIALTLPMHSRFEGLATALKPAFEKCGIETYLIFIRGSTTRLKALNENRCHVTALSGLAAEEHCGTEDEIILELPPGSWVSQYCIFYRTLQPEAGKPLRIAVDRDSSDHMRLSDLVFAGQRIEYKVGSYIQISRLLKNGEVDATVWSIDQADAFLWAGVQSQPLSAQIMDRIGAKSTSAAFVARAGHATVRAVFKAAIRPDEILAIQNKVSAGEMIPAY
jgi:hypothetical protein